MTLITDAYCSMESLQRETGNSESELEPWFEEIAVAASAWIDGWCNRDFRLHDHSEESYTVQEEEAVGSVITLDWPILTLTLVQAGEIEVPLELLEWRVGKRTIRTRSGSHWFAKRTTDGVHGGTMSNPLGGQWTFVSTARRTPVYLTGTFGYAEPPAAVRVACCKIAAAWSHEKRRERMADDGSRVSLLDERVPQDALSLLKKYRKLVH